MYMLRSNTYGTGFFFNNSLRYNSSAALFNVFDLSNQSRSRVARYCFKRHNMATSKIQRDTRDRLVMLLKGFNLVENYRPDWLRNPKTGYRLEIDLFLPEVNVGVEVQGEQHFKFIPGFHKTVDDFKAQQERDQVKREICKERGVFLYEVVNREDIEDFIEKVHKHHPELSKILHKKNSSLLALGYLAEKLRVAHMHHRHNEVESCTRRILGICRKWNIPPESVKPDPTIKKTQMTYLDKPIVKYDNVRFWEKGEYHRKGILLRIRDGIATVTDLKQNKHQFDISSGMEVGEKAGFACQWRLDVSTIPADWLPEAK